MKDRYIVITGGASGIGRATADACAMRGARVALLDVNRDEVLQAADEISARGSGAAIPVVCDVSSDDSVGDAFEQVLRDGGMFDGVFANAGIELNSPLHEMAIENWNKVLGVNLTGVFLTCKFALQHLCDSGTHGSIVCASSPSAFVGFAGGGNAAYGASKGGISALVRSAALDYASRGIRINAVVPGATLTPMLFSAASEGVHPEEIRHLIDAAAQQVPLGRMADPHEIAAAVLWLLSDESSYVTGSNLVCDGGLMAKSANTF